MLSSHARQSCSELNLSQIALRCQAALRDTNLLNVGRHTPQLIGLVVCELVHGALGHVEAARCSVDGQHIDRLALIRDGIALSALSTIPGRDC